jgi:hypothetical protein
MSEERTLMTDVLREHASRKRQAYANVAPKQWLSQVVSDVTSESDPAAQADLFLPTTANEELQKLAASSFKSETLQSAYSTEAVLLVGLRRYLRLLGVASTDGHERGRIDFNRYASYSATSLIGWLNKQNLFIDSRLGTE